MSLELISGIADDKSEVSQKALDVHEDESLLYYLKYGKFDAGQSKKQIKRVEQLAEKYFIEDEVIFIKTSEGNKEVPKINDRAELVLKAHLLGHFQVETTLKRLKATYWWKKMVDDVERCISNCRNCKENHRVIPVEHPAKATFIRNVGERIGIDLVFGLPVSEDGYNGICVITEYFTKYAYAKPIKSKTEIEIVNVFKEYVCLFGPPKILVSDQGNEFNNKLMKIFNNAIGIEHRVTSAYHPRTNGQTEKANYILVEALRRSIGTDAAHWPKYVGWIILSYNSRIHSTTKFLHLSY